MPRTCNPGFSSISHFFLTGSCNFFGAISIIAGKTGSGNTKGWEYMYNNCFQSPSYDASGIFNFRLLEYVSNNKACVSDDNLDSID